MSSRALMWMSVPLALAGWGGVIYLTAVLPVSGLGLAAILPALLLATTMTAAPLIWRGVQRFGLTILVERPAIALRVAFWLGLWISVSVGLRLNGSFSWLIMTTLAVILGLVETFLQQWRRE